MNSCTELMTSQNTAGIVMTISEAVQFDGRVAGVIAMDVRPSYLQQLVAAKITECNTYKCIVVNENGLVVLDDGLAPGRSRRGGHGMATTTDENVFLSVRCSVYDRNIALVVWSAFEFHAFSPL